MATSGDLTWPPARTSTWPLPRTFSWPRTHLAAGVAESADLVTTDAVNRLLTLWGRHSNRREVTVSGNLGILDAAAAALWPAATEWPDRQR
jgi:hypothetical protein